MFGSTILEIAIGLVFIYLLLSLSVTAMQELIDAAIKLRASHLSKGIGKLLGEAKANEFFGHPLIRGLSPDKWFGEGTRRPSYVPSRTFAMTVLDMIKEADLSAPRTIGDVETGIQALRDSELKKSLVLLLDEAKHDVAKFEEGLEGWFNDQMDRVAGWYKRKAHVIGMLLALAVAIVLNADSIEIARNLSNDSALRASLVAQAQEMVKEPIAQITGGDGVQAAGAATEDIPARIEGIQDRIQSLQAFGHGVHFGWWKEPKHRGWNECLPGWLITALAISLGAPFWFDVLNKVVAIRSSGKSPEERAKR